MRRFALALPVLAALLALPATTPAQSDGKPISLGLFTPVQIVPEGQGISGFRFSLHLRQEHIRSRVRPGAREHGHRWRPRRAVGPGQHRQR